MTVVHFRCAFGERGRIEQHDRKQIASRGLGENRSLESAFDQQRDATDVIDMRMTEHQRINTGGIKRKCLEIACLGRAAALDHAAVEQDALARRFEQMTGASDFAARRTVEVDPHGCCLREQSATLPLACEFCYRACFDMLNCFFDTGRQGLISLRSMPLSEVPSVKRLLATALALSLAPAAICADAAKFSPKRLSDEVKTLSSDAFEGRGPATPGETKTVAYVIGQMQAAGCTPAAT